MAQGCSLLSGSPASTTVQVCDTNGLRLCGDDASTQAPEAQQGVCEKKREKGRMLRLDWVGQHIVVRLMAEEWCVVRIFLIKRVSTGEVR